MDAKEFIRELVRMCKSNGETCGGCQIRQNIGCPLVVPEKVDADRLVEIVKDWSTEHPKKTNGEMIMKMISREAIAGGMSVDGKYSQDECAYKFKVETTEKELEILCIKGSWWNAEYKGEQ